MGSTEVNSIINQMEQEMDELQQMHYSTEFSTDINSKMQIPTRLSMGQPQNESFEEPAGNLQVDADYVTNSPAHAMNVPERIMVAGSDTHIGSRHTPRHLDLDEIAPFPTADTVVGLTTPPHTLKMEDVRFPTVGDQSVMKAQKGSTVHQQRMSNGVEDTPMAPGRVGPVATPPGASQALEPAHLQHQLQVLARQVARLEADRDRQEQQHRIICLVGAVYLALRGLRFLYRLL